MYYKLYNIDWNTSIRLLLRACIEKRFRLKFHLHMKQNVPHSLCLPTLTSRHGKHDFGWFHQSHPLDLSCDGAHFSTKEIDAIETEG